MCSETNVNTHIMKCWLNPQSHVSLRSRNHLVLKGEVVAGEGYGKDRITRLCPYGARVTPSTDQRAGRACCCPPATPELENQQSNVSSLMNHSNPEFWEQKTHHRLINRPMFALFHELGVHWTFGYNTWDGTSVLQSALPEPELSAEPCAERSSPRRRSSPLAFCIPHLLHPDQLHQPTLDDQGCPLFLLSSP